MSRYPGTPFAPFQPPHALAAITLALLIAAWIVIARKTPAAVGPAPFQRMLAWSNLAIIIGLVFVVLLILKMATGGLGKYSVRR